MGPGKTRARASARTLTRCLASLVLVRPWVCEVGAGGATGGTDRRAQGFVLSTGRSRVTAQVPAYRGRLASLKISPSLSFANGAAMVDVATELSGGGVHPYRLPLPAHREHDSVTVLNIFFWLHPWWQVSHAPD